MRISRIRLNGCKAEKQDARESIAAQEYRIDEIIKANLPFLSRLRSMSLKGLEDGVKGGRQLSFEEAFCGMCYVLAATNRKFYKATRKYFSHACGVSFRDAHALAAGSAFIQGVAVREALLGVSKEEVAGMAVAAMMDVVVHLELPEVIETAGMGGDRGFEDGGRVWKTINVSTLSSLVLSALGVPSVKHGSYGNTSAVGSTEAIELFGARTNYRMKEEVMRIWERAHFCFLDAHWCKTIHDLSHLLMIETINHIIGPMTPPFSPNTRLNKFMGVNAKVHPEVIAKAYAILHAKKKQNIGGVAIVTGLDSKGVSIDPGNYAQVRKHSILDELSPFASVVSFCYEGSFKGTFLITPRDFSLRVKPEAVRVENVKEVVQRANLSALSGRDSALGDYLAMNAALALFTARYLGRPDAVSPKGINQKYLRDCFEQCREAISSRSALRKLKQYVKATGGVFRAG